MKKQKNLAFWYLAFSLYLLFLMIVLLFFMYQQRNRERIIRQNQQYLEDAASQSLKNMNEFLENAVNSIGMVAHLYESQLTKPEFDYQMLNRMSLKTPFDGLRFVSADGVSWAGDGRQVVCADREYYLEGMQGRSGICYIPSSRFTQEGILIFYSPLHYQGKVIGVVNGVMSAASLSGQMESFYFGESAKEYLCLRDGTVVSVYGDVTATGNILTDLEEAGAVTDTVLAELKDALKTGQTYSYLFRGISGTANANVALLGDEQFMLLQTFPSVASQRIIENVNKDALMVEAGLVAVFLCYMILFAAYVMVRNRKLIREKKDLSQIVNSVKGLYQRFVVFDLEKDTYEYLEEGDLSRLGLPAQGRYSDWLASIRRQHEADPKHFGMMEDMQAEHLRSILTQENWHTFREYQAPGDRWERLSLIKLDMEQDQTNRILGAVEDVTEIKRQEEENREALESAFHAAEAANRAKSDFLSRMSHDIRTPMNAIIGLTAIMGAHLNERERIVDCLAKITSSSKHLLGLINEVLDMSKIESGKLVLSDAEFALPSLVDDVLGIVQPSVNAKHQELTVHINNIVHENVIGDSLRLQQVIVNILGNAVKYTDEGGHISMTISEFAAKQPLLGEYEFLIEDDGIGMPPEFLERIFNPFERVENEQVSKIQGTGLGMPIAQSLVQLMGGNIAVDSTLGKGSRFAVRVSLKLSEADEAASENLIGLPVLVADDDQVACESTCVLLDELGMRSEWVLTGKEAVERVVEHREKEEDFFAVILDWKMPEMDGLETARAIRREVGPDVPIIILSAYDWSEIESEARAAGVNAFMGKPLFKSRLQNVFANLISEPSVEPADPLSVVRERDYSGKRILLVEDNLLNQEIAKEILEMSGLTVDVAENGKVAVEMFEGASPEYYSIVFMDVQMPVMNGYESARAIRALEREDAKKVPIVAMTANTFSEDVHAAMDAGMNQHIAKPLDIPELMGALERWL